MNIQTKQDVLDILSLPEAVFWAQVAPAARKTCQDHFGNTLLVTAMLAYTNICKKQCLYCGMRAGNPSPRYRIPPAEILSLSQQAKLDGLGKRENFCRGNAIAGNGVPRSHPTIKTLVFAYIGIG